MQFLPSSYSPLVVFASLLIASFASYVALDLAKRVRSYESGLVLGWWVGGSLVMGTGIWCMHFVGMLAFSLPIALGYTAGLTVASWSAGVVVSAIAFYIASHGVLTWRSLVGGSLAMGLGICAMHYIGMAALDMSPGIVWDWRLVAASAVIAVCASTAALLIFFWLRTLAERFTAIFQPLAALVMGIAVCGMHYTGMAAAHFPEGSVCLSADALSGTELGTIVLVFSLALQAMTLTTSWMDARLRSSLVVAEVELESANEELRRRAFHDPLTGLPNRLLFEDRLAQALQRHARTMERASGRGAGKVAVLFVDLDRFKPINDLMGHAMGDMVLKEASKRLRTAARDADTVARIGGDEFVVLMEDVGNVADCVSLARRLISVLTAPLEIAGRRVALSGSVGIAVHPDHGGSDKLLLHADAAMYTAKRAGGGNYALYEAHMDEGAQDQLNLQSDLRAALESGGQFELYYQPKVDGRLQKIRGVEALLRWNHPERGMLGPALFIPIAERFCLINSLGNWVIDEACRQMGAWAKMGMRMRVAINLSVYQLHEADLAERIEAALSRSFLDSSQLLCEITESVAMDDLKSLQRTFKSLAHIGVFLSIDDFGTGYSSLSHLRQLPARQLKIDRSFIADIESSMDAWVIVSAVIQLAHELGLRVVAEGVETRGQYDILLGMHCDELQGYYIARPMPADALEEWVAGRKPAGAADFSTSVLGDQLQS